MKKCWDTDPEKRPSSDKIHEFFRTFFEKHEIKRPGDPNKAKEIQRRKQEEFVRKTTEGKQ